jgi:hypothetical protein
MNPASSSKHRGPHHTLSAVHAVPCAPCATNKSSMRKRNEQKQILRASRIGSRTGVDSWGFPGRIGVHLGQGDPGPGGWCSHSGVNSRSQARRCKRVRLDDDLNFRLAWRIRQQGPFTRCYPVSPLQAVRSEPSWSNDSSGDGCQIQRANDLLPSRRNARNYIRYQIPRRAGRPTSPL